MSTRDGYFSNRFRSEVVEFCISGYLKTGSYCVTLTGLELTVSAVIKGVYNYTQQPKDF